MQIYWCKYCGKYFASLAGLKGVKHPPRVIARALCLYNLGHSQEETARRIASEHRVKVPRRTIADWISHYRPITPFHRLRSAALFEFPHEMLKERNLEHQQLYRYKVHLAKLALTVGAFPSRVAAKVRSYLLSVFDNFPMPCSGTSYGLGPRVNAADHSPEPAAALRSSKSSFETLPFVRIEKQNLANDLAALGLLPARRNKDRHPSVQNFMPANDSCTLACEVPVYPTPNEIKYYKSAGFFMTFPESDKPITGTLMWSKPQTDSFICWITIQRRARSTR